MKFSLSLIYLWLDEILVSRISPVYNPARLNPWLVIMRDSNAVWKIRRVVSRAESAIGDVDDQQAVFCVCFVVLLSSLILSPFQSLRISLTLSVHENLSSR